MKIEDKTVVTIDYTLTDDGGEVIDTSEGEEPLSYLHGAGNIVVGLERALEGKTSGDHLKVDVLPEDGYGAHDDELVFQIPKDRLPQDEPLEAGMQFHAETPDGNRVLTLTGISDSEATLDGNHPLAGQTLHFEVHVRDVRKATAEELSHGHTHDGGDHHHH
ncbi:MAG TPA: peptidylprolyl isomerase [Spirochaetia bacterium]|nr:peptidylprolyl isomerase [Spirochaetia bacterium]